MVKKENIIKIQSPKIPKQLKDLDISNQTIEYEDCFNNVILKDYSIQEQRAEKVIFENVVFQNITFFDSSFEEIEFTDVKFINCDLSNINLSKAIIHRTEFINCKIMGTKFMDSTLRNVLFQNSNLDYANFRQSNLKAVICETCSLIDSDFQDSEFESMGFEECNMKHILLVGTKLNGIDLSSNLIEGIVVRVEDLKGVIVHGDQLVYFAGFLGIKIKN